MGSNFKFKLSSTESINYSDAEALFRDLKNRDPKIQHLWSHQADIIRAYHRDIRHHNIALELPTGSGKTLVGLLLAEWRRLTLKERIAYLCPTKQLAHQVGQKATEYGIKAHVLIGPQSEYPPGKFADYSSASAIAITTYSGIFNINPRIANPETIVLDDAHAGENYIAKMWSLSISRTDHKDLYNKVIDMFADDLPNYLVPVLKDDDASPYHKQSIDLLPGPKFLGKRDTLIDLVDVFTNGNDLSYPWQLIRDKLHACLAFFSWPEILIRPWIPPTNTHRAFSGANQRLFMSATLGAGGELERISGIPNIHRIPVPPGWDTQSTGRRLFIFPSRSFSEAIYSPWLVDILKSIGRILVLSPNTFSATAFEKIIENQEDVEHVILHSRNVEETMEEFTSNEKAILSLTNRYDGIDLPGDACRLLIVNDLPTSVNLFEKFLWSNLSLTILLRDRIRTRITQAVGRCTRNSTDYAAIIMVGDKLFDFCVNRDNRTELHPELRAEMDFGLDNSEQDNINELKSLLDLFLSRDKAWSAAEDDILKRRDETAPTVAPYIDTLRNIVGTEVNFQYDLWGEDYDSALTKATSITDSLNGNTLSGYRGLWSYMSGCVAYHLGKISNRNELVTTAFERFVRASKATRTISWFARLPYELDLKEDSNPEIDYLTIVASEEISNYLTTLGAIGTKFDRTIREYADRISQTDADNFDHALTELGRMLGFDAEKPETTGAPDSVWMIRDGFVLVFECKSNESSSGGISIDTCRQAQGHIDWYKEQPSSPNNAEMLTIVVSPRGFLDNNALPHSKQLYYQSLDQIRALFRDAETCLRLIRGKILGLEPNEKLLVIQQEFAQNHLTPNEIKSRITSAKLSNMVRN